MTINQSIHSIEINPIPLKIAARCLKEYLEIHGWNGRTYDVLFFLADATLVELNKGKPAQFKNFVIRNAVQGDLGKDASAWISPIWNNLNNKKMPSIVESIEGFASAKGYEYYPSLGKTENSGGSGNVTLYYLKAELTNINDEFDDELITNADLRYLPAIKIAPAWWASWLFEKDYSVIGWKKWVYIWLPIIWVIIIMILVMLIWLSFSFKKSPINSETIVLLVFIVGGTLYCKHLFTQFSIFIADKIAPAPDFLIGMGEQGVCAELIRVRTNNKAANILRLVKYTSQCPICGAEVLLSKGEPNYPRKIIGKCSEYPQDHTFSFDRFNKIGKKL